MIKHITGNLFDFVDKETRPVLICHVTNNILAWGSGFVVPLGRKYPKAKTSYLNSKPSLGYVDYVEVDKGKVWVANMCAQDGISKLSTGENPHPLRYVDLMGCMLDVSLELQCDQLPPDTVVYCPRFGSERAGGYWPVIERMIGEIWGEHDVTIFTLRGK